METNTLLNEQQQKAIENAREHRISIVLGSPGSGKTFVIKEIIKQWGTAKIYCLAPTGKATNMIQRVIHIPHVYTVDKYLTNTAQTNIHLLIDECSMLTTEQFKEIVESALLEKIKIEKIVLIGDVNQLPPPKSPNDQFLKQMAAVFPCVTLTKLYRFKDESAALCRNIQEMMSMETMQLYTDETSFSILFDSHSKEDILHNVRRVCISLKYCEGETTQFICGTNAYREELNREIRVMMQKMGESILAVTMPIPLFLNEPVVCTQNYYDKGELKLPNGTLGKIVREREGGFILRHENGFKEKAPFKTKMELAYATTIHAAQGDEYDNVIVICDSNQYSDKRMLYTAISRAKKRCVLIGSRERVNRFFSSPPPVSNTELIDLININKNV